MRASTLTKQLLTSTIWLNQLLINLVLAGQFRELTVRNEGHPNWVQTFHKLEYYCNNFHELYC